MDEKKHILKLLYEVFNRWEELLEELSEEQITDPRLPSNWSIKDVIAHLRAWQQISIARLEAARMDGEPVFPTWLGGSDPESEEDKEQYNAKIYIIYFDRPWEHVHRDWREGFLRFLDLGGAISEKDMFDKEKYPWLKGYDLFAVLQGSYGHHEEHLESLLAWLRQNGSKLERS
jgi:hypothetical protein